MKKMRCVKDLFMNTTKEQVFTAGKIYEATEMQEGYLFECADTQRVHSVGNRGWGKYFKPILDTPEPKYRLLKPITGRALMDDGACQDELGEFIKKYGYEDCATNYCVGTPNYCLAAYISQIKPKNLLWLIDHGYLERIEERTYFVGQKIVVRNRLGVDFHVISHRPSRRPYVSLRHGNVNWRAPIQVKNMEKITQAEMDQMVSKDDFYRVVGDDDELPPNI